MSEPHRQQVLPQPKIHIAAEPERLLVHGVTQNRSSASSPRPVTCSESRSDNAMVADMENYLERCDPQPDPRVDEVTAIVERIERDTDIHRVDQAAAVAGLSSPSLQRLFTDYVGIAPKWVIQRRRLLDAAERAHSGDRAVWAELADRLRFSDQAHLVRAFTAAVGPPPATYARAVRTGR